VIMRPQADGARTTGRVSTAVGLGNSDPDRARRFRDATLPHLDAIYTLARYLMRNEANADDAVQECYLRALRHFDTLQNSDIKPWLFAILRNVCRAQYGERSGVVLYGAAEGSEIPEGTAPLWSEAGDSPETEALRKLDAEPIRRLIAALPDLFREAIVLREINDLSYREIAEVTGAPVGTVMSRLARARSMLRTAWLATEGQPI
jgi:RNA polymerase sigma-70 factor (ECF subfamily)